MKILLTIIIIFQFGFIFGQTFNVITKNVAIEIKELIKPATNVELTHAVKYNNKFYCFFNEVKKDNLRRDIKFCFIFSDKDNIIKKIEVPDDIQNTYYYDLFIKNDTIFVKTYMKSKTFYFDSKISKWVKTEDIDDLIFEDDRFYFTYLNFGEWGATTWCKDKKTKKEYELASSGTRINKIYRVYYITSGLRILKIDDPTKMKKSNNDYLYEVINKKEHAEGTSSLKGAKIIFNNTTFSYWEQKEPKILIATSFIKNSKLYHLCVDSTRTFVAELINGQMITTQRIGAKISFFDWHYSDRNKIQKDGSQILKFKTNNTFGIVEINKQGIYIYNLIPK